MSLEEKINGEIKAAMLSKNTKRLEALRGIKAEILLLNSSEKGTSEELEAKAMQKNGKTAQRICRNIYFSKPP